MWQKSRGKFHLLLHYSADAIDGSFLQSACGDQIQVRKKNQKPFFWYVDPDFPSCPICVGVWRLCFTSVDDAKSTLRNEKNMKVLNRSLEIARQSTLRKAIETRIRRLLSEQKRERKLRLTAKAYE